MRRPLHSPAMTSIALAALLGAGAAQAQGCGAAMPAFQAAIEANTAEAVAGFLAEHPGCFTAPAEAKLAALGGASEAPETAEAPDAAAGRSEEVIAAEPEPEPAPARPDLAGLPQALGAIPVCREGLDLLRANMYEHPGAPAEPNGKDMSWAGAYARFQADHAPACKTVQALDALNAADPAVQAIRAAFAEQPDYEASYAPLAAAWDGSVETTLGLIENQGSRIPDYCPGLHLVQFNCVTAPERIGYAADWMGVYMDRVEALAGG